MVRDAKEGKIKYYPSLSSTILAMTIELGGAGLDLHRPPGTLWAQDASPQPASSWPPSKAIKPLEERLHAFCRLRVGPFRVIFLSIPANRKRVIRCEFAECRKNRLRSLRENNHADARLIVSCSSAIAPLPT